ncbi:hypothetical protein [Kitasatospora purpeofusca]|uniref:hypothetical protein n=1 Tax=Kitasatospora purpeofusca TaxID=67352 RepID=UPI002A5A0AE0|nr:hypothetical protein [Kitasatospora purpeofusca]MDY0813126.1 hypothetical protein [Kitasatospora purpeofusca]
MRHPGRARLDRPTVLFAADRAAGADGAAGRERVAVIPGLLGAGRAARTGPRPDRRTRRTRRR